MDIFHKLQGIEFSWNSKKSENNEKKHNITFLEACEVFFDPFVKVMDASQNEEAREALIGYSKHENLLFVVYLERHEDGFRIVSARLASSKERECYENS